MSSSEKATRRRQRQQFIDEIMFDHGSKAVRALTALERNVGIMITKSINPDTGETFEHASSFAKRLGGKTKVRHVEDALKVLEALDWSRIEQVAAVIGRGWKDGECQVAKKVDPNRSAKMADQIKAIQSALTVMEYELRKASAAADLLQGM
jgi:hypothetical protein